MCIDKNFLRIPVAKERTKDTRTKTTEEKHIKEKKCKTIKIAKNMVQRNRAVLFLGARRAF